MGRRGRAINQGLLARIYKLLSSGDSISKVVKKTKKNYRTVYRYTDLLVEEGSLKRTGKSPAIYYPQAKGYKYERLLVSPDNVSKEPNNVSKPSCDGSRGNAEIGAAGGPSPLHPLDIPSRLHHSAFKCKILEQPSQDSPLLHWSNWIPLQNGTKQRKTSVLLDIGTVVLVEFPGTTVKIFLPERKIESIQDMNNLWRDEADRAQAVATWLGKQGYRLGLPEQMQPLELPADLPQLNGQFQGMIIIKNPDGTQTHIDMSKGWVEVENQLRSCNNPDELEKAILWAMGPSMLQALVHKMDNLDLLVKGIVVEALKEVLPGLLDSAMKSPQVIETLDKTIKESVDKSFQYTVKPEKRAIDVEWM